MEIRQAGARKGFEQAAILARVREKHGVTISGLTEIQGHEVLDALNNGKATPDG